MSKLWPSCLLCSARAGSSMMKREQQPTVPDIELELSVADAVVGKFSA